MSQSMHFRCSSRAPCSAHNNKVSRRSVASSPGDTLTDFITYAMHDCRSILSAFINRYQPNSRLRGGRRPQVSLFVGISSSIAPWFLIMDRSRLQGFAEYWASTGREHYAHRRRMIDFTISQLYCTSDIVVIAITPGQRSSSRLLTTIVFSPPHHTHEVTCRADYLRNASTLIIV